MLGMKDRKTLESQRVKQIAIEFRGNLLINDDILTRSETEEISVVIITATSSRATVRKRGWIIDLWNLLWWRPCNRETRHARSDPINRMHPCRDQSDLGICGLVAETPATRPMINSLCHFVRSMRVCFQRRYTGAFLKRLRLLKRIKVKFFDG